MYIMCGRVRADGSVRHVDAAAGDLVTITAARPPQVEAVTRVSPRAHRRETFLMPRGGRAEGGSGGWVGQGVSGLVDGVTYLLERQWPAAGDPHP